MAVFPPSRERARGLVVLNMLLALAGTPSSAAAASTIYYSVGTRSTSLHTGTASATGGTLTLASAASNNVGVGDEIRQAANRYYITGRVSSTVFTIQNSAANGGTPGATTITFPSQAIQIYRAFTLLSTAVTGSSNASHLNTSNLVTGDYQLSWASYDDGAMNDMVNVTGWTTGPSNYVRIFTPVAPSEVGASQRHRGVAGTGFRLAPVTTGTLNIINLNTGYARIEGLEIDGSAVTSSQRVRGISVADGLSNAGDIRIDSCIIHGLHTTLDGYCAEGSMGILDVQTTANSGPPLRISNNVIYDITNNVNVGHIAGHPRRVAGDVVRLQQHRSLNINNPGGASSGGPAWGIYAKAWPNGTGTATVIATNNYVGNVTAPRPQRPSATASMENSVLTQSYNVSSDGTASGTGSQTGKTSYATYFTNTSSGVEDLHLRGTSSSLWASNGMDLSADANLPVTNDIDGGTRGRPDIGADEYDPGPQMSVLSGTYTGNGVDDRAIFVGFQPDVVIVDRFDAGTPASNFEAVIRTSTMIGDAAKEIDDSETFGSALAANLVQSLGLHGIHDRDRRQGQPERDRVPLDCLPGRAGRARRSGPTPAPASHRTSRASASRPRTFSRCRQAPATSCRSPRSCPRASRRTSSPSATRTRS